jgi:hypothetical protein
MTQYKVVATYKVRHVLVVDTDTPEGAENVMDALVQKIDWQDPELGTMMSAYSTEVEEYTDANV